MAWGERTDVEEFLRYGEGETPEIAKFLGYEVERFAALTPAEDQIYADD